MQQQRLEDPDDDGWYDVNTSEETPDNVLHDKTYDISHEGGEYQEYIVDMNARASYLLSRYITHNTCFLQAFESLLLGVQGASTLSTHEVQQAHSVTSTSAAFGDTSDVTIRGQGE
ncbi:hypothetical protein FRC02_004683 [Tulasnella sp. 418]|nr:hypothetical protein FRC02_004683 [Tulasnella sp. 418]